MNIVASHVFGTGDEPLRYRTIGEALEETVSLHGERMAMVVRHQGLRWTWRELAMRAERLAAGFVALGLAPGDRIGICAPNCAEWVLTQLASAKAGLILVTINPAYRASELEHALELAGVRALVLAERFKSSNYVAILASIVPQLETAPPRPLRLGRLPALEFVIQIGTPSLSALLPFAMLAGTDPADHAAELAR